MKNIIMYVSCLVILFVVTVKSAPLSQSSAETKFYNLNDAPKLFQQFIKDNDRKYKDEADKEIHYKAFVDNLKFINKENAKNTGYTLGITLFADLTPEERANNFSRGCLAQPKGGATNKSN